VIRPASYVPDSKPVDELLRQMQAQRSHVAIVIDEYGGTAGLVTIEDILEEIVGEITDEYDNEQPPVEWLSDGSARVTARLSATELGELFGVNLEEEDVETVAGLLAHALRPGPDRGLYRDRARPAAHRGEPGGPAQQDRHGAGGTRRRSSAVNTGP
jgi:Hemolysins and related proteins containing CBS domains